jgi:hypothetical protein
VTKRKKRAIVGQVTVDGSVLNWSVRSEPQWNTTAGDIGLRLSIVMDDDAKTRHGETKTWRELILEYPFEKQQKNVSRFPDRPKIEPQALIADIRLAMAAGWQPWSRGRTFTLILEESDLRERSKA